MRLAALRGIEGEGVPAVLRLRFFARYPLSIEFGERITTAAAWSAEIVTAYDRYAGRTQSRFRIWPLPDLSPLSAA